MRHLKAGVLKEILALFTVNGDLIREVEIPSPVSAWSTFASPEGFDYLAIALANRHCYILEAFYLSLGDPVIEAPAHVVGISYILDAKAAVVVSVTGSVSFIPVAL
jgi:hypothetical protein